MSPEFSSGGSSERRFDAHLIRWATEKDRQPITALSCQIFDPGTKVSESWIRYTIDDVWSGKHPQATPKDYIVAVDRKTSKVIGSAVLFAQPWRIGRSRLDMGRPEIVVTDAGYRQQGVMRHMLEALQQRSKQYGHVAQCITGRAYIYRTLGYEYSLPFGARQRLQCVAMGTVDRSVTSDHYSIMPAEPHDAEVLDAILESAQHRTDVSTPVSRAYIEYSLSERNPKSRRGLFNYICRHHGEVAAVVQTLNGQMMPLTISDIVLHGSADPMAVGQAVLSWVAQLQASDLGAPDPQAQDASDHSRCRALDVALDESHEMRHAFAALGIRGDELRPNAWYIAIPETISFLEALAEELDRRLASSVFRHHTGVFTIDSYRGAISLDIKNGTISNVFRTDRTDSTNNKSASVNIAPDHVIPWMTGHRSLDEVMAVSPETTGTAFGKVMASALFPKLRSHTFPLD